MKIRVTKDKEDIITTLVIDDEEVQFDYVALINGLYKNDRIEEPIHFSDDIEQWEREEIQKLISEINKSIVKDDLDENERAELEESSSSEAVEDENEALPF